MKDSVDLGYLLRFTLVLSSPDILDQQRACKQPLQHRMVFQWERQTVFFFPWVPCYCLLPIKEKHIKKEPFPQQTKTARSCLNQAIRFGGCKDLTERKLRCQELYAHPMPFSFSWAQCTQALTTVSVFFFEVWILCLLLGINTWNHCCYCICLQFVQGRYQTLFKNFIESWVLRNWTEIL